MFCDNRGDGKIIRTGTGIQSFRAFYKKLTIKSKTKESKLSEIIFKRGEDTASIRQVDEAFFYDCGTKVTLSEPSPTAGKRLQLNSKELKERLEKNFEKVISDTPTTISICKDGSETFTV